MAPILIINALSKIMISNSKVMNNHRGPITSYGIILFRRTQDDIEFLLLQRRDSIAYTDFLRNNYNRRRLYSVLENMTEDERQNLLSYEFDYLWNDLWCGNSSRLSTIEYSMAKKAFIQIRSSLQSLINKTESKNKFREWGFAKGRRQSRESYTNCALREFEEESTIPRENVKLLEDYGPYIEIYTGTNDKIYRTIYYVAELIKPFEIKKKVMIKTIRRSIVSDETGDFKWCKLDEAFQLLNTIRKNILKKVYEDINTHTIEINDTTNNENNK